MGMCGCEFMYVYTYKHSVCVDSWPYLKGQTYIYIYIRVHVCLYTHLCIYACVCLCVCRLKALLRKIGV